MRIRLSAALIGELHVAEVENFELESLTGGHLELANALEAIAGRKSATIELSHDGAKYLVSALDNMADIAGDNTYPAARALARVARAKRDEVRAMLRGPTMSNPGRAAGSLVGLGVLDELEILDPRSGRSQKRKLRGRWLGWDARRKRFAICRVLRRANAKLDAATTRAHRRFHTEAPTCAVMADVPEPSGRLQQVGLVKALTYIVPRRVASPEKNPYRWHHAFGDTGHNGGGSYPQRVMPALVRDAKGNLFIKRRPGNIFTVDTWLRG